MPESHYYRLHHIRPRFKNNIEQVLIYVATEIAKIGKRKTPDFIDRLNSAIKMFPGNQPRKDKTINNWRTEISSLFGFVQTAPKEGISYPSFGAVELADKQDLIHTFKMFLYFFQYPGGHLKSHETVKFIEKGIRFKPAKYILQLLVCAEESEQKRIGINKAELTHCVFNDLRVTCDGRSVEDTWSLIKNNRAQKLEYDWNGDVIRYAGDILDYMQIANLLDKHGSSFYLNNLEQIAINTFLESDEWFGAYDRFIENRKAEPAVIKQLKEQWFLYVNKKPEEGFFDTDILALIAKNAAEYEQLKSNVIEGFLERLEDPSGIKTKEIGDAGESIVQGHECMRVKLGGREDLIHLIKNIPNHFAVGYDIQSVELDETKRMVEVKTTISSKELDFSKFHLTRNEWKAAESHGERYYVYRLLLSKRKRKLFLLKNPVGQYKEDKIRIDPRDGVDVTFNPNIAGNYTELLVWTD